MKKIHYCWFGETEKSDFTKKCIESWRKIYPDFEIIEWNEKNFDIACNKFVREAYKNKEWAFVSDYVRLYALYNYGGIYLDTDVIAIKRLNNEVLFPKNCILGFEDPITIGTAVIIAKEKSDFILKLLDAYEDEKNAKYLKPNVILFSRYLMTEGLLLNNKYQNIGKELLIFPTENFYPKSFITNRIKITDNTFFVHDFEASWITQSRIKKHIKKLLYYILGEKNYFSLVLKMREKNGKY